MNLVTIDLYCRLFNLKIYGTAEYANGHQSPKYHSTCEIETKFMDPPSDSDLLQN